MECGFVRDVEVQLKVAIQHTAQRFISQNNLSFEKARELANAWAEERGKQTTAPFYGNANDWESIELLRPEMERFCINMPLSDRMDLLASGDVATISCSWPIVNIVTYLMYKALAKVVWKMVDKNQH